MKGTEVEIDKLQPYLSPGYPAPVEQDAGAGGTGKHVSPESVSNQDQVLFSKGYQAMSPTAVAGEIDEVRMEKVNDIRLRLDQGSYVIKPEVIAERMLSEHMYN